MSSGKITTYLLLLVSSELSREMSRSVSGLWQNPAVLVWAKKKKKNNTELKPLYIHLLLSVFQFKTATPAAGRDGSPGCLTSTVSSKQVLLRLQQINIYGISAERLLINPTCRDELFFIKAWNQSEIRSICSVTGQEMIWCPGCGTPHGWTDIQQFIFRK